MECVLLLKKTLIIALHLRDHWILSIYNDIKIFCFFKHILVFLKGIFKTFLDHMV